MNGEFAMRRFIRNCAGGLLLSATAATIMIGATANAQELPIATFPFPSVSNIIADIIVAKGFDKANGLTAKPIVYGTGGALWAGLAKGEIPVHNMSPFQLQKMRSDGVPIVMFGTLLQMTALQVVSKNPDVKTFADLKGRSFAGSVAFAEFSYLQIYARTIGLEMMKDMQVVDANSALAQAQLEANRVDAIMTWEPAATLILKKNPDVRVILKGDDAWKAVTGDVGWELDLVVRTDYVEKNPGVLPRMLKMYKDAGDFLRAYPDEADTIVTSGKYISKGIPPGTIADGAKAGRLVYDVQPSWDPHVNAQLWKMIDAGLKYNQIPALPERSIIMSTPPK
jgi:ABC-type nitrate/sulfonate/bicarbonate transport system substrate-binding protein